MILYNHFILWLIAFSFIEQISSVSYNRPKFCPLTTWNSNGLTFANSSVVGKEPYGLFIDTSDSIYVTNRQNLLVRVWSYGSVNPTRTISDNLTYPRSLFVTIDGDVYVDNGDQGRVDKWSLNSTNSKTIMNFSGICFSLFVDLKNNLYCSVGFGHQVERISLNDSMKTVTVLAGNGTTGSTSSLLDNPRGIFVDVNLDLYIADTNNGRIQLFQPGEVDGQTMAGNGASGTFTLITPHGVTLDGNGYLFIVDSGNGRIIGSGPNGFRCLVGCSGKGSTSNKLSFPQTMAFDSYGNIFVTDRDNNRVQKFILATNSCKFTTITSSITTLKVEQTTAFPTAQIIAGTAKPTTVQITEDTTKATTIQMAEQTIESRTCQTTIQPSQTYFIPPTCSDADRIGLTCNVSNLPCDVLEPCQSNGICSNTNMTAYGYQCSCPPVFSGINCEINNRLCDPNPCWNDGQCHVMNTTFNCSCSPGWQGSHCQTKINYCENVTCMNNGLCRPLFLNYTCECLRGSFHGFYCEITATKIVLYQIVSKSFACIAIIVMASFAAFIIVMDVLKYYFGIDPTHQRSRQIRQIQRAKQNKIHINHPSINVIPSSPRSHP